MTSTTTLLPDFIVKGLLEILGDREWQSILDLLGTQDAGRTGEDTGGRSPRWSAVMEALTRCYGENAGLGLAQRSGSASFKYFQTQYSDQLDLTSLEMRTRPLHARLREGLKSMAACLNGVMGMDVTFEERGVEWYWKATGCQECSGRESREPLCFFTVGLIVEYLSWSSGGKFYPVEEIACCAKSDPHCEFLVASQPID